MTYSRGWAASRGSWWASISMVRGRDSARAWALATVLTTLACTRRSKPSRDANGVMMPRRIRESRSVSTKRPLPLGGRLAGAAAGPRGGGAKLASNSGSWTSTIRGLGLAPGAAAAGAPTGGLAAACSTACASCCSSAARLARRPSRRVRPTARRRAASAAGGGDGPCPPRSLSVPCSASRAAVTAPISRDALRIWSRRPAWDGHNSGRSDSQRGGEKARGATQAAHHFSALRLPCIWGPTVWHSSPVGDGVSTCGWASRSPSRPGLGSRDDVLLNLRRAHGVHAQRTQLQVCVSHAANGAATAPLLLRPLTRKGNTRVRPSLCPARVTPSPVAWTAAHTSWITHAILLRTAPWRRGRR